MPLSAILVVAGIVAAFSVFGLVLAWGDHQTRHINRGKAEAETAAAQSKSPFKKAA
jgi:ureidoglycolate hydrolase